MQRVMKVINKDYKDKCSNLEERQHMQVRNFKLRQNKDVTSVLKTNKDALFVDNTKFQTLMQKKVKQSPISKLIDKISPDRLSLKADSLL